MNKDMLVKAFDILDEDVDSWEYTDEGDVWAINYDAACRVLKDNGIQNVDAVIPVIADYYWVDVL